MHGKVKRQPVSNLMLDRLGKPNLIHPICNLIVMEFSKFIYLFMLLLILCIENSMGLPITMRSLMLSNTTILNELNPSLLG